LKNLLSLYSMEIIQKSDKALQRAAAVLKTGGVVIFPTDTVYGFLADAANKKAVEKMFKIKKRPKSKPVSLFVKDFKAAHKIAIINPSQARMLRTFWPGKVTAILQSQPGQKLYGLKKNTVGIRIPNHAFLKKLLKVLNLPLVQTSVNISNQEPLNSLEDIWLTFGKSKLVDLIIDGGDIKNAKPSKVVDLTYKNPKPIRL
jgi:L-threonylcarbamoyladenylate synthase